MSKHQEMTCRLTICSLSHSSLKIKLQVIHNKNINNNNNYLDYMYIKNIMNQ